MAYNGSVEVVSGLKQKNNANFPIVDASAVYVSDGKNLADIISGIEETSIKDYIDNKDYQKDYQSELDAYNNRLVSVENAIGDIDGDKAIAQKLIEIDEEIGLTNTSTDNLKNRVTSLEGNVGSTSVDTRITSAINTEKNRATAEENAIKTRVTSLETNVGSSSVDSRISASVTTEKTRATGEENAIKTRVGTLETNVGSGSVDTRITNAVNTEKTRATTKENEIAASVTTEKTRATGEENAIKTRVGTLETNVGSGSVDTRISTAVATETTRATNKESELNTAITTEKTRATAKENEIVASVTTEKDRAVAKENEIATSVTTEKTRATGEENAIKTRVSDLETNVGSGEEVTSESLKAIVEETARSTEAEESLEYRIEYIEGLPIVMSISNNAAYATHLNTITDSKGNILAFFDTAGDFHVNGNIYSKNW